MPEEADVKVGELEQEQLGKRKPVKSRSISLMLDEEYLLIGWKEAY